MGVKYLSDEWAQAVQEALNSNDAFKSSIASQNASVQNVVTTPEGEQRYWFKVENGEVQLGTGDAPGAVDATITQDYDTAVALARNELTGTAAYMSGKLRVSGDLMKLMAMQGTLQQLPAAIKDLDIEY